MLIICYLLSYCTEKLIDYGFSDFDKDCIKAKLRDSAFSSYKKTRSFIESDLT